MSTKDAPKAPKKPRILTFDLLRGYFMVSIILNHLQWYPNGYDWVAMRGSLLVSAAEGFFLLSGLVLGIVRGRKLLAQPFRIAATLLLKRGVLLYVTSIVLTFLFMVIGWWLFMDNPGLKPGIRPIDQPLGEVILGIMSFDYLYGWADFLRLYAIFIFATPPVLWLVRKGYWYIALAISVGLWALFPWALEHGSNTGEILMILSWQFIFFGGFILGFYWEKITATWEALTTRTRRLILWPALGLATVTLLLNIALESAAWVFGPLAGDFTAWYHSILPYFNKNELPLPRIILFVLWFTLGFYLFKRLEKPIMKYLGWLLIPFGQNSLYAYILHAILIFFAHLIISPGAGPHLVINFIGATLILGVIYLAIKKQFLFKIIPR